MKRIIILGLFCCSLSMAGDDVIRARMKLIVIPEVDFRNTRLEDVLNSMIEMGRKHDPSEGKGINLVLNLTAEEKEKKITMSGKNIPFSQLLNTVSRSAGIKYQVAGNVVMVGGSDVTGDTRKISKNYGVPLTISGDIRKKGAKKFLEELGVKFPEGASATYIGATGKMIVVNTTENIKFMEKILRGIGVSVAE